MRTKQRLAKVFKAETAGLDTDDDSRELVEKDEVGRCSEKNRKEIRKLIEWGLGTGYGPSIATSEPPATATPTSACLRAGASLTVNARDIS